MASTLGVSPPEPNDPIFDRLLGALLADDILADDLATWIKSDRSNRDLFEDVLEQRFPAEQEMPEPLARVEATLMRHRPAWADAEKMKVGALAHYRLGGLGRLASGTLGLLDGYRCAPVAKALVMTGSLETATRRRLDETSKFANEVLESEGLQRSSAGFKAAIRVRLVHSYVRHGLLRNPVWRRDLWGLPVSIMDSLGTAFSFWVPVVLAAPAFGYTLTRAEAEGMMTLWNYVGWLQGVPEELLPTTLEESYRIYLAIMLQIGKPDADSVKLAQSYLSVAAGYGDGKSWIREKMVLGATARLIVPEHRRELGVKNTIFRFWVDLMRPKLRRLDAKAHADPTAYAAAVEVGRRESIAVLPAEVEKGVGYDPTRVIRDHTKLAA